MTFSREVTMKFLEELKQLKDEIKVQSHLLSLELKSEFETVEPKVESLLTTYAEEFGEFNEQFWIGNKKEISELVDTLKKLQPKS